jgi:transglutaminase-like putative cysteine protease
MRLRAICDITFEIETATPLILMLRPQSGPGQWVASESYILNPVVPATEFPDMYGNLCQRLLAPTGHFAIHTDMVVDTAMTHDIEPGTPFTPVAELPDRVFPFLLPSRYCESDQLHDLAADIVTDALAGYDQVEAIRAWLHHHISYQRGVSDTSTSALDTVNQRAGVCRDMTHLGIGLCRSLDIPARMVVGYLHNLKPMDMHAWFEAFVGGRWYTFDAMQAQPGGSRIAIAYGRDATDVALATTFGPATMTSLQVKVEALQRN